MLVLTARYLLLGDLGGETPRPDVVAHADKLGFLNQPLRFLPLHPLPSRQTGLTLGKPRNSTPQLTSTVA